MVVLAAISSVATQVGLFDRHILEDADRRDQVVLVQRMAQAGSRGHHVLRDERADLAGRRVLVVEVRDADAEARRALAAREGGAAEPVEQRE